VIASTMSATASSVLFHRDVPDDFIVDAARVMQIANWHTYRRTPRL
jgi:protein gp37